MVGLINTSYVCGCTFTFAYSNSMTDLKHTKKLNNFIYYRKKKKNYLLCKKKKWNNFIYYRTFSEDFNKHL